MNRRELLQRAANILRLTNHRQVSTQPYLNMKSSLSSRYSSYLKAVLLLIQLIMCFGSPTIARAGDKVSSFGRRVGPELDYRTELPQGYLVVYSATDTFDDGDMPYYAHSAYAIYTAADMFGCRLSLPRGDGPSWIQIVNKQLCRNGYHELSTRLTWRIGSRVVSLSR